jgi:hypothetical protein
LRRGPQYILVTEGFSYVNFDYIRDNFLISPVFSAVNDPVPYCQSECWVFTLKKIFLLITCLGSTLVTVVPEQTTATLCRCSNVHTVQPCREPNLLYAVLSRTVRNRGLRGAFHKSNFSSAHFYTSI